jgi:hypothetical protein
MRAIFNELTMSGPTLSLELPDREAAKVKRIQSGRRAIVSELSLERHLISLNGFARHLTSLVTALVRGVVLQRDLDFKHLAARLAPPDNPPRVLVDMVNRVRRLRPAVSTRAIGRRLARHRKTLMRMFPRCNSGKYLWDRTAQERVAVRRAVSKTCRVCGRTGMRHVLADEVL